MADSSRAADANRMLSAQELLLGAGIVHDVRVPPEVLAPGKPAEGAAGGTVRMRPLNVTTLSLISRASQEDPGLVPLLMIKESLVEPALTLEQIRGMHVGLVDFLVRRINVISGLSEDGESLDRAASSPLGRTHLILAKHFGWTPEQVAQLTPGQVAVYLAGIEQLLRMEERGP